MMGAANGSRENRPMNFWEWAAAVNWWEVLKDAAIPVAAILIPTWLAVRMSKGERESARLDGERERRLDAGAGIIVALAPLASMSAVHQSLQEPLWDLRARIAVYRAWISVDDISGDWLALRHREGMILWAHALDIIDAAGGPNAITDDQLLEFLSPAHQWAATTTEMFSGWLSGHVKTEALQNDGARILEALTPEQTPQQPHKKTPPGARSENPATP